MHDVLPKMLAIVDEAVLFDNSDPLAGAVGVMRYANRRHHPLVPAEDLPDWVKKLLMLD